MALVKIRIHPLARFPHAAHIVSPVSFRTVLRIQGQLNDRPWMAQARGEPCLRS